MLPSSSESSTTRLEAADLVMLAAAAVAAFRFVRAGVAGESDMGPMGMELELGSRSGL